MKSFVKDGKMVTKAASGADIESGEVVEFAGIGIGVAAAKILDGYEGEVAMEGVYRLAKATPLAIAQGARVYWDNSAKKLTTVVKPTLAGYAHKAAASGDLTLDVKLVSMGDTDPGNLAQAAFVAFSAGSNLVGVDGTGSNAAPLAGTETRLDSLDTAVAAILASLIAAGLMAAS